MFLMELKSLGYDTALNDNAMHLLEVDIALTSTSAYPSSISSAALLGC